MSTNREGSLKTRISSPTSDIVSARFSAVEAQAKALRNQRRREEEEAHGTQFGREILDTEVYEQDSRGDYLGYLPGQNDDEVSDFSIEIKGIVLQWSLF